MFILVGDGYYVNVGRVSSDNFLCQCRAGVLGQLLNLRFGAISNSVVLEAQFSLNDLPTNHQEYSRLDIFTANYICKF